MLQIHTLKPAKGSKHRVKRIGRGNASGHGTYSTRGGKGQTARSGGRRGLWLKSVRRQFQSTPKLRGFRSLEARKVVITLSDLEKKFQANEVVSLASLKEKELVGINDATAKIVKTGKLTKKLIIEGIKCSQGAMDMIKAAGGEVK